VTEVKLCGMTRAADVDYALSLRVRYVGCVFAGGPRHQTVSTAAALFQGIPESSTGRVGVFASARPQEIRAAIDALALEAVQLHGDPTAESVAALRREHGIDAEIWAVVRCTRDGGLPAQAAGLWQLADAVVLDARVEGQNCGNGATLAWSHLAAGIADHRAARARTRLVVAGGLTPDNVGRAIAALRPDVVDVSSGIESVPGSKDPLRMRAFVEAVAAADHAIVAASNSAHSHLPNTR
jgi:phosphoribosylanthranilate isomerase